MFWDGLPVFAQKKIYYVRTEMRRSLNGFRRDRDRERERERERKRKRERERERDYSVLKWSWNSKTAKYGTGIVIPIRKMCMYDSLSRALLMIADFAERFDCLVMLNKNFKSTVLYSGHLSPNPIGLIRKMKVTTANIIITRTRIIITIMSLF